MRRDGLQVVEKKFNGVTVGFVVGWWFYPRRGYYGDSSTVSFRSFRNGVLFDSQKDAEKFRDKVEDRRATGGVQFSAVG